MTTKLNNFVLTKRLIDYRERRLKICATCEYQKADEKSIMRCGVCGCRLNTRVWTTCPKHKW